MTNLLRKALAIVAGYGLFSWSMGLLFTWLHIDAWTMPAPGLVAIAVLCGVLAALVAGYVAQAFGRGDDVRYARLISLAIALASVLTLAERFQRGLPLGWWFPLALLLAPISLLGGLLHQRLRRVRIRRR